MTATATDAYDIVLGILDDFRTLEASATDPRRNELALIDSIVAAVEAEKSSRGKVTGRAFAKALGLSEIGCSVLGEVIPDPVSIALPADIEKAREHVVDTISYWQDYTRFGDTDPNAPDLRSLCEDVVRLDGALRRAEAAAPASPGDEPEDDRLVAEWKDARIAHRSQIDSFRSRLRTAAVKRAREAGL